MPEEDVETDAAKLEQHLLAHPLCWMARQINFIVTCLQVA